MSSSIVSNGCEYTSQGQYKCPVKAEEGFGFDKAGASFYSSLKKKEDTSYVTCCYQKRKGCGKEYCVRQHKMNKDGCNNSNCPAGWVEKKAYRRSVHA